MQNRIELRALPDWSAVPSNSLEDCQLLNRRIAYFAATLFWLSLAFYLFSLVTVGLLRDGWLEYLVNFGDVLHLAATAVFGLAWLACRSGRRPAGQLNLLDVGTLVLSVGLFAWKGVVEGGGFQQATVTAMTSLAVIVTHAIIVPATARRAFWVSSIAAVPATVAAYFISGGVARAELESLAATGQQNAVWVVVVLGTTYIGMWSGLSVAVATLAARVIYGLREQAREAREIGQYTLEAKLGAGGMGVVYRARHSLLRRPTAIKLLPRERAGDNSIRRFEREVQLTSALTHPNTVAVFDFGRTPDGIFYYVMEYLDGITLQDLVDGTGPLPPARVVHVLRQLCGALIEAHATGLVHRDIKPANLMLCVRGLVSDHLKVLDFGLVKDPSESDNVSVTNAAALIGTPSYMAPESIMDPTSVGAAADLYSVGAVAYFLLAGEPVFVGTSSMEVCIKHVHEPPVPLSKRASQTIPAPLEELVLACLRKLPGARPGSALELRARLDEIDTSLGWSSSEADTWWESSSRDVIASARARHAGPGHNPGPQTMAIDWAARHTPTLRP